MGQESHSIAFTTPRPASRVRVQRSGNSKVLPVPAEISRLGHVELGQDYIVEYVDQALVYRPAAAAQVRGSGPDRYVEVPGDQVAAAPQRAGVPPLDWEF